MKRTFDRVSRVVIGLATDCANRNAIEHLFERHRPFHVSRLVELLCEGVMRGNLLLAMRCGVDLALLHPILSHKNRRCVAARLLPVLARAGSLRRRTAAAYALQYNRSPEVLAQFQAMSTTKAGRRLYADVVGEIGSKRRRGHRDGLLEPNGSK